MTNTLRSPLAAAMLSAILVGLEACGGTLLEARPVPTTPEGEQAELDRAEGEIDRLFGAQPQAFAAPPQANTTAADASAKPQPSHQQPPPPSSTRASEAAGAAPAPESPRET